MIPIFDTHAHLDLEQFSPDRDAVIRRIESGTLPAVPDELVELVNQQPIEMTGVLLPGIDAQSSYCCVELAQRSPIFHAAAAIHPNYVVNATDNDWKIITELAQSESVSVIGETGLDRYWDHTPIEQQINALWRHIDLAVQTAKPIQIHCRDAWNEMLPILRKAVKEKGLTGIIHAFSGEPEQATECIELGFYLSFAGSVTYRNTKFSPLWESAKMVPADRLLIETDSPYMPPHPFRGKLKRNEPTMAVMVALRLAELRSTTLESIAKTTTQNAQKLLCTNFR
ncbi:MAG: TatD family hydrolase [Planctomycetaceae bacterium]|jgi:TatD DNase family protein|nr:TatD family hydrolase [Planctomycetaceae bacterium]